MLNPNDKIALFCSGNPQKKVGDAEFAQQFCQDQLKLNATYNKDALGFVPAKDRAKIFLSYLFDDDIKALCALRGGEGTADIIPFIHERQAEIQKLKPKIISGFSDITALLLYFAQVYRWPVAHGPGISQIATQKINKPSQEKFLDFLCKDNFTVNLNLTPVNAAAKQNKIINAELTGGNLSLINISIGDIWEIDCDDKIVFLEDVSEKPHAVNRTLKYLQRIGKFEKAKAIILGDFVGDDKDYLQHAEGYRKVIGYFAETMETPVLSTEQIGHGQQNLTLPFCREVELRLAEGGAAIFMFFNMLR